LTIKAFLDRIEVLSYSRPTAERRCYHAYYSFYHFCHGRCN